VLVAVRHAFRTATNTETLPEQLVKVMMQCYEHVLYKNDMKDM